MTKRLARALCNIIRRGARDERGTQLVELSLVLPVMILLFASVAEFGRFFYTYATLAKATRAAARYAATRRFDSTNIAQAQSLAAFGDASAGCAGTATLTGLTCANFDLQQTTSAGTQVVTARVTGYPYQPIIDLGKLTGISAASLNIDVSPSVTMRYVY